MSFPVRASDRSVGAARAELQLFARDHLLEEIGESAAHAGDGVGVVRIGRRASLLEVGTLAHQAPPFDVDVSH